MRALGRLGRKAAPSGSRRRKWVFGTTLVTVAGVMALFVANALAVHDQQFQLDGDTSSTAYSAPTGANPPFDWNDIFNVSTNATTQTVSTNSANVGDGKTFDNASFVRDFETGSGSLNSTSTTFNTADSTTYATGSKDTLGIGNGGWQCNHDANVNSKIDIMNAYVLGYTNPSNGDKIIYFGLEKNKNNGTNDVGFWFLQNKADCSAPSGHLNFTGQHQNNDTLVVSEFTQGGGVSTIKAFRWAASTNPSSPFYGDGGCIDSNDNPDPRAGGCNGLPIATGADCKSQTAPDTLCATTNATGSAAWNQNVTTKWLTADATLGVGNTVVPPDFFEGGIDVTKAFASAGGTPAPSCFNTIVPDTRSSASVTATLFDYTLNQIGQCQAALSTQQNFGAAPKQIGTDGTISSGTDSATLKITGTPTWGGTLTWYLCGPDVTGCDTHGVKVTSETVSSTDGGTSADTAKSYSTSDTSTPTAVLTSAGSTTGQYCWHAQFVPNAATAAAGIQSQDDNGTNECFTVTPRTPTLTTKASCSASPCVLGSTLSDTASLTGTANNPNNDGPGGDTGLYKSINGTTKPAASSITWALYGPGTGGAAQCSTAISSAPTPSSVTVSGDNTSYGPVSYATGATDKVGSYTFAASYPGDGPNTLAATAVTCDTTGANGEQVTVTGTATSSTAQRWLPNDRVVLSSTSGTTLNGQLTVTLYKGSFSGTANNCTVGTATAVTGQSYQTPVSSTTNSFTYNTSNTTFVVGTNSDGTAGGSDGTYFWLIHYVDNSLTSPADRCETSTISHNDG